MKDLQFTVYEVVGYFIPGVVALAGVYLLGVALLDARLAVIPAAASARVLVALGSVAYALGHCIQAIGNALLKRKRTETNALAAIPSGIRTALAERLSSRGLFALP